MNKKLVKASKKSFGNVRLYSNQFPSKMMEIKFECKPIKRIENPIGFQSTRIMKCRDSEHFIERLKNNNLHLVKIVNSKFIKAVIEILESANYVRMEKEGRAIFIYLNPILLR